MPLMIDGAPLDHDTVVSVPSGEISIEAALADLGRAYDFLASCGDDDAHWYESQGHAADVNLARELLVRLAGLDDSNQAGEP